MTGHKNWVTCVALSDDMKLAISCGLDKTIRVWDYITGT